MEVSWVEHLVEVSLDQQGGSLRGPLAVRVPHGHPLPRMVPVVVLLLLLRSGRKPSRAPQQWRCARLPGLGSWVCAWVWVVVVPGWERFARGFSHISYAATTVTPKE